MIGHPAGLHRSGVPDDFRLPMPETPAGQPVLTLDLWGYFARVWSAVG